MFSNEFIKISHNYLLPKMFYKAFPQSYQKTRTSKSVKMKSLTLTSFVFNFEHISWFMFKIILYF